MKYERKQFHWWMLPVTLLAILLLVVGGYVAYVFGTYNRIEDNLVLEPEGDAKTMAASGETYTIISYNIGFGAYTADFTFFMDGGRESRARSRDSVQECVAGCSDTTLSFDPDFVLFQEVDTGSTRSFHVQEEDLIKDRFAGAASYDSVFAQNYHSAYLMYPLAQPHGASNSGLLTMSREDISSALRRSLPIATGVKKILDLDRCYSICRVPVENGKELILVNVHLSAYGTDASQGNAQLEMLFDDLKKEYDAGNYVVCGGDFNHDFTGDSKHYFNPELDLEDGNFSWCNPFPADLLPDGFSRCTGYADGMVASTRNTDIPYSEDSFTVILDGFIVSDNVECTYVQNVDTGYMYTDHNPVVMNFILK